jgi:predicted acylesterase/phospholipase RssA
MKTLVFSGGGTRCLSFLFALKQLIDNKIITEFKNVYGTSAGSFIAALVAIGKLENIDKIIEMGKKTEFKKALNIELHNLFNFSRTFGLDDGRSITNMIKEIMEMVKENSSGYKLKDVKELNIVVADMTDAKTIVLNYKTAGEMLIVDAIRASMSLPFIYTPFINSDGHMFIDGGLRASFPWDCLENDEERKNGIGFVFQTSESGILGTNPVNLSGYINRLINFDNLHVNLKNKDTWSDHMVFVNVLNYPAYYMNVKESDLIELENAGIVGAKKYIEKQMNKSVDMEEVGTEGGKEDVISHVTSVSLLGIEGTHLDHGKTHQASHSQVDHQESRDGMLDTLQYSLLCKHLSLQQHNHISRSGPSGRRWSV